MAAVSVLYHAPPQDTLERQFKASQQHARTLLADQGPRAPAGFPAKLLSPLAWTKDDMSKSIDKCIVQLSADDVIAAEAACHEFKAQGIDLKDISSDNYLLPTDLANRLRAISDDCYHGHGFVVIKGLDPSKYTREENVVLYSGISAYVAPEHGFLNKDRTKVICHVLNAAQTSTHDGVKNSPGLSDAPLAFHTDNCEILALYALDMAPEGGQTYVSSAYQLYNDLAESRPDILQTLSEPWVLDSFRPQDKPQTRPMLHMADDHTVTFNYSRYPMTGFRGRQRSASLPAPTPAQVEAMDTVQYLMAKNAVPLPWSRGDIVYINDMAIMHARSGFRDPSAVSPQRHLIKFYLRDPAQNWTIATTAKGQWNRVYEANNEQGGRVEKWSLTFDDAGEGSEGGEGSKGDDWQSNG